VVSDRGSGQSDVSGQSAEREWENQNLNPELENGDWIGNENHDWFEVFRGQFGTELAGRGDFDEYPNDEQFRQPLEELDLLPRWLRNLAVDLDEDSQKEEAKVESASQMSGERNQGMEEEVEEEVHHPGDDGTGRGHFDEHSDDEESRKSYYEELDGDLHEEIMEELQGVQSRRPLMNNFNQSSNKKLAGGPHQDSNKKFFDEDWDKKSGGGSVNKDVSEKSDAVRGKPPPENQSKAGNAVLDTNSIKKISKYHQILQKKSTNGLITFRNRKLSTRTIQR